MGTISIDHSAEQATVGVEAERFYSDIVVGTVYTLLGADRPEVGVNVSPSRVKLTPRPTQHVLLVTSKVKNVVLWAPSTKQRSRIGMDGIAELKIDQGQWVDAYAYLEDRDGAAILQAGVELIESNVYRTGTEGGESLLQTFPVVATTIYDTIQYAAPDTDGWNFKVRFELLPEVAAGGSLLYIETTIELTTGELLTVKGRLPVNVNLSQPVNAW